MRPVTLEHLPPVFPFIAPGCELLISDGKGNLAEKKGEGIYLSAGTNTIYLLPTYDWVEAQLLYEDRDHLAWN